MNNNKNVFLAIFLAAAVLFVWQYFVATPSMKAEQARQAALAHQEKTKPAAAPVLPGIASGTTHMTREAALKVGGKRVVIDTPNPQPVRSQNPGKNGDASFCAGVM